MSASLQKRPNCCVAAKCREGPVASLCTAENSRSFHSWTPQSRSPICRPGRVFFNCASLCGNKSPLGAFDDHRCFPVLPLRCDSPTLGCHRHPVGRVERVGGGHTFPEINSRQRPAIRRDPIILADQTRDSLIVLGRRIDVSISWPLDVPAGSLYVHITVCIVRLQRSNNFTLARSLGVVSCQPPRRSNYLVRQS